MKKILLFVLMFLLFFALSVSAHPPGEIEMSFNMENKMLEVTIPHDSQDSTSHFVDEVKVYLNGNEHIEQAFIVQTNNDEMYLHYMIPGAEKGDSIRLTAECNRFGNSEIEITIE
jgi:hypothetical protein